MNARFDIAILGAGPAAWSTAAALAPTGLSVTLIGPSPLAIWPNTYAAWDDQVDESVSGLLSGGDPWAQRFESARVIGQRDQTAGRTYGRFDNGALATALQTTAETGRLTIRQGNAIGVDHTRTGSTITLSRGRAVDATLVLDGTGAASPFVLRPAASTTPAFQVAYGIVAEFERDPLPPNVCTFMDWRGPNRAAPSFAYTLPVDGRWLVEETSLASRPALAIEELECRLHDRLRADGLIVTRTLAVERVSFPMDLPLPDRSQRVVGLGAAASLVHPATGYSVGASLRMAPRLARALADALGRSGATPEQAASAGWTTMWSDDRVKARRLEAYGLERVLTMNQADARSFFDSFFRLPVTTTATYLGGEAGSSEMAAVMWKVFRAVSPRLQRRLASGNPLGLARSLLRGSDR